VRQRSSTLGAPVAYRFPLLSGSDASALSRFVHQVLDADLCTADTVVIVVADGVVGYAPCQGVLNVAIERLARRHVLTIVVSPSPESHAVSYRAKYENSGTVCFVGSEGEAAHLILTSGRSLR
jgi:hypothetical protein